MPSSHTITDTTARDTVMPAEWEPHERAWLAFPPPNATFGQRGDETLDLARRAWSRVARTIARYEKVTVVAHPGDIDAARDALGDVADLAVVPLDDAWIRDSGPTFVHDPEGRVAAVDWVFNGWGAQEWASWENDRKVGAFVADTAGVPVASSELVNEGGGFHVDGRGTVLLTETVQLDPGRNPGATRERVEALIHEQLGTTKAIWLPRGLSRDYDQFGTRGHVDIVAAFAGPGTVLMHEQTDPRHPDHAVSQEIRRCLEAAVDATGQPLRVVGVPAPTVLTDEEGYVDWSYINHYVGNGVVVLCAFDDPRDAEAARILQEVYPDRTIELVDARDIFAFGGGIHCITQQQPAPRAASPSGEERA